jgi:Pyruvate/2-oxoacid:ferredoxin oxidoreductase gamma subunit
MKSNIYDKAVKIAIKAKFPDDIIAEINKEAADKEYGLQNYEQALQLYIKTIGFLNPSYVI